MKKIFFFILISICLIPDMKAQVGINTTDPKVTLDVKATNTNGSTAEGIIAPRLSLQQVISKNSKYTTDQMGAIIFVDNVTGTTDVKTKNIKQIGYYYFDGNIWQPFVEDGWSLTGNKGTNPTINHLGTQDDTDLVFVRNGVQSGRLSGLIGNGANNTLFGVKALSMAQSSSTENVAIGNLTLTKLSAFSKNNTAIGYDALSYISSGIGNTVLGSGAGSNLRSGSNNIAIGINTLMPNTNISNTMNIGNLLFGSGISTTYDEQNVGRIGIGTNNPITTLHINGDLMITETFQMSKDVSYLVRNNASGLVGIAPQAVLSFSIAAGDSLSMAVPSTLFYPGTGNLIISSENGCARYLSAIFNIVISHPTDFGLPIVYINSMARQVVGVPVKISDFRYELTFPDVIACTAGGDSTMFDFIIDTGVPGFIKLINKGNITRTYTLKITQFI